MVFTIWKFFDFMLVSIPGIFLCIYTANDKITVPIYQFTGGSILLTIAFSCINAFIPDYNNLVVVPYLFFAFLYFNKVTALYKNKVLYLFLMIVSYICSVQGLSISLVADIYLEDHLLEWFLACVFINAVTLPPMAWLMRLHIYPLVLSLSIDSWILLSSPPLLFSIITCMITIIVEDSRYQVFYFILNLFLFVCSFLTYYAILYMMKKTAHSASLEQQVLAKEYLLSLMNSQYDTLNERIKQTKAARHDHRHQMTLLKHHLDSKDFSSMEAYLSELLGGDLF